MNLTYSGDVFRTTSFFLCDSSANAPKVIIGSAACYKTEGERLKSLIFAFILSFVLVGTLIMIRGIQTVQASGTIYIRADGSIDPPTAPIQRDGDQYTFMDNIYDSIAVERNNTILDGAGYTVQGAGTGTGITLSSRSNVTVKNAIVIGFNYGIYLDYTQGSGVFCNLFMSDMYSSPPRIMYHGIWLYSSSNNKLSNNTIEYTTSRGILLVSSHNNTLLDNTQAYSENGIYLTAGSKDNTVSGNIVQFNNRYGMLLDGFSSGNTLSENTAEFNSYDGINLYYSGNNTVFGNTAVMNRYGIRVDYSSDNTIYHNNLIDNGLGQAYVTAGYANVWDDGYPSGGNYWSDYIDFDSYKGLSQDEIGSDGVWDHPYAVGEGNLDRYPLTKPYGGLAGDVDGDRDVDIFDIVRMATIYGVKYPNSRYDRPCDMDLDGDIDIFDVVAAATNYGKSW